MFFLTRSRSTIAACSLVAAFAVIGSGAFAQSAVQAHAYAGTPQQQAAQSYPAYGAAPAQAAPQSDRLDKGTLVQRGLTLGVGGAAANYGVAKVSGAARGVANVGKVKSVPGYGGAISSLPVVGGAAAGGSVIPTTLGQVPVMGAVVKQVPVVGPVVAGPANPILVGAVAIDNYVIPKYAPCGYTKSSVVAATNDFNTPPRLRSYVNYLAPMPYTHPPIYSPATLNTDLPADLAYIDGVGAGTLSNAISVPGM